MMAQTTKRILYHLVILATVITLSTARPQNSIDSQDIPDYQSNYNDIKSYYNTYPSQALLDNAPLGRLQMLIGQMKQQGSGAWDNLYRAPEMKRQARYRQCYFNPISCFKK